MDLLAAVKQLIMIIIIIYYYNVGGHLMMQTMEFYGFITTCDSRATKMVVVRQRARHHSITEWFVYEKTSKMISF